MSAVMMRAERHVAFTAAECGSEFGDGTSDIQAEFLVAWNDAIQKWNWPQQCNMIARDVPKERRAAVALMLKRLVEHLEEPE